MKFEQVLGVVGLGVLGWGALQVHDMKADLAVVTYKVEENYKMIKPMWQDFLVRSDQVRVSAD
jgi:aminoglycoside phosphotransferase